MGYISNIRKKVGHDPVFMPAAAGVIVKDNKMLLQKRTDNGKWAVHGGALELGESFLDALEREFREELNIKPINPELINVYSGKDLHLIYPNDDEVFLISAIYVVHQYEGEVKMDYNEVSEIKWFDIDQLPDEIHTPDVRPINDIVMYIKRK